MVSLARVVRVAVAGCTLLTAVAVPLAKPAPASAAVAAPAAEPELPVAYLTFDDGPGVSTPAFLDLLATYDARATFFVTGKAVTVNPDTARRIVADGHAIANHTWNHPKLTSRTSAQIADELHRTTAVIASTTGVTPTCFRPPYGATDARVQALAVAAGLPNAEWTTGSGSHRGLWDIDTNDWRLSVAGSSWTEGAMRRELDKTSDGDVVLMHDGYGPRPRGLAVLRGWLAANHDRFDFRPLPGCGAEPGPGGEPEGPPEPPQPEPPSAPPYEARFQIARLYRAYFDRQPDAEGWAYWIDIHGRGHSLADISHWFALSSEFREAGELTDEEFVTFVYANVLDRRPDDGGYRNWLDHLDRGMTRGQLVVHFSESSEFVRRTAPVLTGDCFDGEVDSSYRCWATALDGGA
ncbi:MAG: polysaccharide deacetylase family protein [Actinomycetota bacterium]